MSVSLLLLAMAVGCAEAPTEEAEHAHYNFKPVDFPDAIDKLVALQLAISGHASPQNVAADRPQSATEGGEGDDHSHDGHEHQQEPPLQQWHLIVRWLPETAADSDLKRESWERIAEPAKRLFNLTSRWERQFDTEQEKLFRDHQQELTAILAELEQLAEREYSAIANSRSES